MFPSYNKLQYILDELTIQSKTFFGSHLFGILLQSPYTPESYIRLFYLVNLCCQRFPLHKFAQSFLSRFHHKLKIILFVNGQCQSWQCQERITCARLEPRITGKDIAVVVFLSSVKLVCCIDQTMKEIITWGTFVYFLIKQMLQRISLYF